MSVEVLLTETMSWDEWERFVDAALDVLYAPSDDSLTMAEIRMQALASIRDDLRSSGA